MVHAVTYYFVVLPVFCFLAHVKFFDMLNTSNLKYIKMGNHCIQKLFDIFLSRHLPIPPRIG